MSNKSFEVLIEIKDPLQGIIYREDEFEYDWDLDSLMGVFPIISDVLYNNNVSFVIKVNGITYPTFIVEFSIFLENLLEVVDFVNRKDRLAYSFDFYEQGINYLFKFEKAHNDFYKLEFIDQKNPSQIVQVEGALLDLNFTLFTFYSRLIFLTNKFCLLMNKNELFVEWKAKISGKFEVD